MSTTMLRYNIAILIVLLKLSEVICRSFLAEEGPFEIVVHNTSSCVKEPTWFRSNITTYTSKGRTLMRGTVVTEREMKNVKFRIRAYYLENGMVNAFDKKNQNCRNFIVRIVLGLVGLPYDQQKCIMKPVTTEFSNMDMDAIIHSIIKTTWYGVMQIRWEIFMPAVQVMCLNVNFKICKPSDKKDGIMGDS